MSDADKDQLAVERNSEMTVGMSLKLAYMTRAQAVEQAWREAELQIRDADAARQETEDTRSRRRNRNRLGVLAARLRHLPVMANHLYRAEHVGF